MLKTVERIEKYIVCVLLIMLLLSVIMGTFELSRILIVELIEPPYFLIDINRLFETFGLFLVILIGLELMKSVKTFLVSGAVKPDVVVEVAIIAIGNKLITLDIKHVAPEILPGLAATLLGLAALYFVLKKTATS